MKGILKLIFLFTLHSILSLHLVFSQCHTVEQNKINTIIETAIDLVSTNLSCFDTTNKELSNLSFFLYLRESNFADSISISLEPIPISEKTLLPLKVLGYIKRGGRLIFVAVNKDYTGKLPTLISTNTLDKLDSVRQKYYVWENSIAVFHYFYFYITYRPGVLRNRGKLNYIFFNDFEKTSMYMKGKEKHYLVKDKYFSFQYTDIDSANSIGNVFTNVCNDYQYLSEKEKKKLFTGTIKVKFK